jgi:hypothetical protein
MTTEAERLANAAYVRGNVLWKAGKPGEAERRYIEALSHAEHPDIHLNLGIVQLCQGRDRDGWANYGYRPERRSSPANRLGFPEWQGEPLAGKRLFIWPEQGLGDQIFAARFVGGLGAGSVTMVTAAPLAPLLAQLPARVIPRRDPVSVGPEYDYWSLPLSLPRWAPPAQAPYLSAQAKHWNDAKIGVMWRGNARPDPGRSLPPHLAKRLLSLPGAISLQPEDTGAKDFRETAELIMGLKHVITIDTSVAHLTGALGKRGTVLLTRYPTDWRWREASPGVPEWYPSLRILRQHAPGDWSEAVARAADQILNMPEAA